MEHLVDEKEVQGAIAEIRRLIEVDDFQLTWRTCNRLFFIVLRGGRSDVPLPQHPAIVALAKEIASSENLPMSNAAFVFYMQAARLDDVDATPLRHELESEDPFRWIHAAEALAYLPTPDPAAIPRLDELLRHAPDHLRWNLARSKFS